MASKGSREDKFANYAIVAVTESAANTLTFKKLETAISLMDKVAWIISRVEYYINAIDGTQFNTSGDAQYFGLSLSNSFATPLITEQTIIDYNNITHLSFGTAATAMFLNKPIVKDFSALPMGGILIPPNPLYLYSVGSGLAAASVTTARIHYLTYELSTEDYWQLVEARRVLSS